MKSVCSWLFTIVVVVVVVVAVCYLESVNFLPLLWLLNTHD